MNESSSLIKTYLFIRKNRFRRKQGLYKTALSIMVDKTTAVYLLVLVGYLIASFFIVGDFISDYNETFVSLEGYLDNYIGLILILIPIRAMMGSFSKPGIIYSTSEHQLSFLPFSRKEIWVLAAIEKWLISILRYSLIGLLIILMTPLSANLVLKFIGLIILMEVLMTLPQWKLFQKHLLSKIGWLILLLLINAIYVALNSLLFASLLVSGLVIINLYLSKRIFSQVNWSKVTEMNDFKIWNMPLISRASGVKLQRQKKYSFFQNLKFRKKPFTYKKDTIHRRIWGLYLAKDSGSVIQLLAAIIILLFILMFTKSIVFQIGLAFSLHAYTSMIASFYIGRFEADLLNVLPWDLSYYKKTFFKWANYGALIILIPVLVAIGMNVTIWFPVQLIFYITVYYYLYQIKINKAMIFLAGKRVSTDLTEALGYLLLLGVIFSVTYPVISFVFIIVIWLSKKERSFNVSNL